MANRDRQPVVQKAMPGPQRYQDSTNNARVGKAPRVEVMDADRYGETTDTGEIAPTASWVQEID